MSGNTSSSNKVYVLYKVSNTKYDSGYSNSGQYNAFTMSRPSSTGIVTLAEVKRQCLALRSLHDLGPHGYHWRVRVDDARQQQQQKSNQPGSSYTWWDVIDENSRLPVKENVPLSELEQLLGHHHSHHQQQHRPSSHSLSGGGSTGVRTGVVAGAVRKAFQNVASTVEEVVNISSNTNSVNASDIDFNEPRVSFLVFKLLDLIKLQKEYISTETTMKTTMTTDAFPRRVPHRTDGPKTPLAPPSRPSNAAPIPSAQQRRIVPDMRAPGGTATTTTTTISSSSSSSSSTPSQRTQHPSINQSIPSATANRPNVVQQRGGGVPAPRSTSTANNAPTTTSTTSSSRIAGSQPLRASSASTTTKAPARSSSEELLMDFGPTTTTTNTSATTSFHRSYSVNTPPSFTQETKEEKLKREYAEKAQQQNRVWDPVDERWVVADSDSIRTGDSANDNTASAKIKGITLDDASNAIGKSAHVQSAVQQRVTDMKTAQEKAKEELKQRKEMAALLEQEEDKVRVKLDPKIKQWSEEHGQKKQLAALLASLHLVIWSEAQWKPVNLGDLLEEKKLRSCYKRASLKVHPDKTKDLTAEQRFLAKRIFDALTQAMTVYEDAKRS